MATLASTYIDTFAADTKGPLAFGGSGMIVEVWRVASGGASSDTVAITPRYISDIRGALTGLSASHDLAATATETNVTFTLRIGTNTAAESDIFLFGRRS